jgi:hypothetical protein|tara:strand:+ start:1912 stop:2163 length:252 start_codon:yes stop_codon:yes gene_type:complete
MKKNDIIKLYDLLNQLISETSTLNREMNRIRQKIDSDLYKTAIKYQIIDNNVLICKNKFRNSCKSFVPKKEQNPDNTIVINFD